MIDEKNNSVLEESNLGARRTQCYNFAAPPPSSSRGITCAEAPSVLRGSTKIPSKTEAAHGETYARGKAASGTCRAMAHTASKSLLFLGRTSWRARHGFFRSLPHTSASSAPVKTPPPRDSLRRQHSSPSTPRSTGFVSSKSLRARRAPRSHRMRIC